MSSVVISSKPIDVSKVISAVRRKDCGGIVIFVGSIRDNHREKKIRNVEIEAYDEMATQDLRRIIEDVGSRHPVGKVAVAHRTGKLNVGDIVVVIAVSAPHRKGAFDACREIIDEMKKTTPIWKQEFFEEGGRWVESEAE